MQSKALIDGSQIFHSFEQTLETNMFKKILAAVAVFIATISLSACISVSESNVESGKQIAIMSQQAVSTCGAGNVEKVTTTSFSCKDRVIRTQN